MKTRIPASVIGTPSRRGISAGLHIRVLEQIPEGTNTSDIASLAMEKFGPEFEKLPDSNWKTKEGKEQAKRTIIGKFFEFVIMESLLRAGVEPLHYQVKLQDVPLARFDFVLYHSVVSVILPAKRSLRERWKQAALEGKAAKDIYPQAKVYLIVGNAKDTADMNKRIKENPTIGIDDCIFVDSPEWPKLLSDLAESRFEGGSSVRFVEKSTLVRSRPDSTNS